MTVSVPAYTEKEWAGDGSTTAFSFQTIVPEAADIKVWLREGAALTLQTLGTHYSLSGLGDPAGVTINFVTAPAGGKVVMARRATVAKQTIDYGNLIKVPGDTTEAQLDRFAMALQDHQSVIDLQLDISDLAESAAESAAAAADSADEAEAARDAAEAAASSVSPTEFPNKAAVEALTPAANPLFLSLAGHDAPGDYGAAPYKLVGSEPTHAGKVQNGNGAWYELASPEVHAEMFGAYGDDFTNCTTAILNAVEALRRYPKDNIDTIGGNVITMYNSGRVNFGPGIFRIDPDALEFFADMNLEFVGAGSRGMTNSMRARTTLLIQGTSSGFGIKQYRGGARGLAFRNIDICYESAGFTGDLIDSMDSPWLSLRDSFAGTFGIAGSGVEFPVRQQTARSLVRLTYDEGVTIDHCVLDGGQRGVWWDDVREELGNTGFGGWGSSIINTILYDFADTHLIQTGSRNRTGIELLGVRLNPINLSPTRALDISGTCRGLSVENCDMISSVASAPSTEWARFNNCTGTIKSNTFGVLANGFSIEGRSTLEVAGNNIEGGSNHGMRIRSGSVTSKVNKFYGAGNAYLLQSDGNNVHFDGSGDDFGTEVTSSINVISTNASLVSGAYDYDALLDQSDSKFENNSERLKISSASRSHLNVSATTETITRFETGREIRFNGSADQVISLAAPHKGTRFTFFKVSDHKLTINAPGGTNFYTGNGAVKSKIEVAAIDVGISIELDSYDTVGWRIRYSGTVTLT